VVALIGDGAAQFTFMELASAVQENLPIIVLLWNNNGYREIREGMLASGIKPVGVDVDAPDFIAAAVALGCFARRVESVSALQDSLFAALDSGRPAVLELPEENFLQVPLSGWY
jgi:acetolactate synthase-1/2/3 large subunit